ncbi:MAG: hypothetical protein KatS3mg073_1333 [Meiothermus sp.]|nr:MAG: hypothetical protein KatS3mg073_1333 [Meiothermus sp.]
MSFLRTVSARARGYLSTEALEAYRRAGAGVYALLGELEASHPNPWTAAFSSQIYLLCVWNAFALQTLGDQMLAADEHLEPTSPGLVPPQTHALIRKFYQGSAEWLASAREAEQGRYPEEELPASLPPWEGATRYPRVFLEALLEAAQALQQHVEARWGDFEQYPLPGDKAHLLERLRQKRRRAQTKLDYTLRLLSPQGTSVPSTVVQHLRLAVSSYFRLGQFLALPVLLDGNQGPDVQDTGKVEIRERLLLPEPVPPPPMPWRMTDPRARPRLEQDGAVQAALRDMRQADPDPQTTQAMFEQIQAALERGLIAYALSPNGQPLGPHRSPPFAAVYVALKPLKLWGQQLQAGQLFSFETYRLSRGGTFRRALVVYPESVDSML